MGKMLSTSEERNVQRGTVKKRSPEEAVAGGKECAEAGQEAFLRVTPASPSAAQAEPERSPSRLSLPPAFGRYLRLKETSMCQQKKILQLCMCVRGEGGFNHFRCVFIFERSKSLDNEPVRLRRAMVQSERKQGRFLIWQPPQSSPQHDGTMQHPSPLPPASFRRSVTIHTANFPRDIVGRVITGN